MPLGTASRIKLLHPYLNSSKTLHLRCRILSQITKTKSLGEEGPLRDHVVGFGSSVVDYLAVVEKYPMPDQKIRTEELKVQGGGNCGNALTAAAKLGLKTVLLTKLGDDGIGSRALRELEGDKVDTSNVIIAKGCPSPFTYIIVDKTGSTRTCIHTPAEPLLPEEITGDVLQRLLSRAALIYFDGRLTEAALVVAKEARKQGIPILVEGENLRSNLDQLLEYADYIITSSNYPQDSTGAECIGDSLLSLAARFPKATWIITTFGRRGSVALERSSEQALDGEPIILDKFLSDIWTESEAQEKDAESNIEPPACTTKNGFEIRCGDIIDSNDNFFVWKYAHNKETDKSMRQAKDREKNQVFHDRATLRKPLSLRVRVASSACIDKDCIRDTTGAGDAFIGAALYAILNCMPICDVLRLATVAAACSCTEIGARAGQATLADLRADLLSNSGSLSKSDEMVA